MCFKDGLKREEVFVTTKVWPDMFHNPKESVEGSLKRLKLDYVDLLLCHFPNLYPAKATDPIHKVWPRMEALVDEGLTKNIGVSNFNVQLLIDMIQYARIKPAVD